MKSKNRFIVLLMAALFSVTTFFSGAALAEHCSHDANPSPDLGIDYND